MPVSPIPDGYHAVTLSWDVRGPPEALLPAGCSCDVL